MSKYIVGTNGNCGEIGDSWYYIDGKVVSKEEWRALKEKKYKNIPRMAGTVRIDTYRYNDRNTEKTNTNYNRKIEPKQKQVVKTNEKNITIKDRIDQIKKNIAINREKENLLKNWRSIMAHCGKYNSVWDSFEIVGEEKTAYGWQFKVYAPDGLALRDLDTIRPQIESGFGCIFMHEIASSKEYATCRIVYENKVKCNEIPFEPVEVKPYEVYPGLRVTGEPLVIDSTAAPHVLLAGGTRRGKNGSADSIILSWLNSCNEKEIELYLFQCAKVDLIKYSECKQVKCCVVGEFEEMLEIIENVVEVEIRRRLKMFEPMFKQRKGENIVDYNRLYPHKKLPYCWLIFDEFLELMNQSKHKKEENEIKNAILGHIERIAQMGAAVGIQYMIIHQKPEKALCPTFIKNMSNIRICFGFDDESCGRIVLGDRDGALVLDLPPRRAYVNTTGSLELIFTTNLTGRRDMFIRPHEVIGKTDILSEIRRSKNKQSKIDESKIRKISEKESNKEVKQDAGTAVLPKHKKITAVNVKRTEKEIGKELKIPSDIKKDHLSVIEGKKKSEGSRVADIEISEENGTGKTDIPKGIKVYTVDMEKLRETLNTEEKNRDPLEVEIDISNLKVGNSDKYNKDTGESTVKSKAKRANNGNNKSKKNIGSLGIPDIDEIDIDKLIAENAKKIPGWVPYVPSKNDKVPDYRDLKYLLGSKVYFDS